MTKLEVLKGQYQKALDRLDEVLQKEKNEIIRDSAIKRFEFLFDLSWKLIKAFLEEEKGVACVSPKECFQEAYKNGVIEYDDFWLKMTDWRNQIVHTYNEGFANSLYKRLPEALERFQSLRIKLIPLTRKRK